MSLRVLYKAHARWVLLLIAVVFLVSACSGASGDSSTDSPTTPSETSEDVASPHETEGVGEVAPDLVGVSNWINSEPLELASLRGQVVLIDFWTYTCVNCIRTFPFLKEWDEKYRDRGLVIIGVHAPEFEFEEKYENVVAAVEQNGIAYPVVQDNDMETWRAFDNRFWPAKYLIDADGVIRYSHFGEGAYDETESVIRQLLVESGTAVDDIIASNDAGPVADPRAYATQDSGQTRELYLGVRRNASSQVPYIGNLNYYYASVNTIESYSDPGDHGNHFVYLNGEWRNGEESIVHARKTTEYEDYVALKFAGKSANVVLDFVSGQEPFDMRVTIDGRPFVEDERGSDVVEGEDGQTYIRVTEARLYNIAQLLFYGEHELVLSANSDIFAVFAFTFGSYADGP